MGLIGCLETSIKNYHTTLCNNISEEWRSQWQYDDAGLGVAPHGLVPSDLVWHFISEFKMSHI